MKTGEEFRASMDDGRRLYLNGAQVKDLAAEPLLAPAVDMVAAGYDRHYQPGDVVGPYYDFPRSVDDLRAQAKKHGDWDMVTVTTADGLQALVTAAARIRADLPVYADRIDAYYEYCKRNDLRSVQCITDAKGHRNKPPGEQDDPDFFLRIVEQRPDGLVINGAKLHISAAALAHELVVMPTKRFKSGEEQWAVACGVPVNAEGVKVINTTYTPRGPIAGEDPAYWPYSSRHSMPEGFVVFDNVFVPNERVFLAGEVKHSATFAHSLGLWERLGGLAHLADNADVLVGLAVLIAEANGVDRIVHIREKIAHMMMYATLIRSGLEASIVNAEISPEGWAFPSELYTNAAKHYAAAEFNQMLAYLHDIAGGAVLTAPSPSDLASEDIGPYVEKYMRTMDGVDADYRMRLFHTIRDYTADTYGGWQLVTWPHSGGGLYAQRLVTAKHYDVDHAKRLALEIAGLQDGDRC